MTCNITSKSHYHETMIKIYALIQEGEEHLSEDDLTQLQTMAFAAEYYKDEILALSMHKEPKNIADWVEQARSYQSRRRQRWCSHSK